MMHGNMNIKFKELVSPVHFPDRLWVPSSPRSWKHRVSFCGTKGSNCDTE